MAQQIKSRYWVGVLYPENMLDDWQDQLEYIIQRPYCYCIHDKDLVSDHADEERKVHVHMIICWNNNTTYAAALRLFQKLSKPGLSCCNKIEYVENMRFMFDYLIHDTPRCRKQGKHLYDSSERVCGNLFDIEAFAALDQAEKDKIRRDIGFAITKLNISNYADLYDFCLSMADARYIDVLIGYSGHFERLCRGVYHRGSISVPSPVAESSIDSD